MKRRGSVSALQREVMTHRMVPDAGGEPFSVDLRAEMLRFGMDYRGCQRLEALGVDGRFVCELSAALSIGAAKLTLSRDGSRWEPEGPDARLLLAVTEGDQLCDIAAVSTSHPGQVALRTGMGVMLGDDVLEDAERAALAERRFKLRLFGTPLEWLREQGRGVCVLDWGLALPRLRGLGELVTLECDAGTGERVRALLKVGGLPRVKERPPMARREAA